MSTLGVGVVCFFAGWVTFGLLLTWLEARFGWPAGRQIEQLRRERDGARLRATTWGRNLDA